MASGDSIAQKLRDQYLNGGSLDWQGLGGGIVGAVVTAFTTGVASIYLGVGTAFRRGAATLASALTSSGDVVGRAVSDAGAVWDAWSFGFLSLPATTAVVLVGFVIFAWGWQYA